MQNTQNKRPQIQTKVPTKLLEARKQNSLQRCGNNKLEVESNVAQGTTLVTSLSGQVSERMEL